MKIPESHFDLLKNQNIAVLTTVDVTGQPNSRFIQCDYKNRKIFLAFSNKKISLTIMDPVNDTRWLSITGNASVEKQDKNKLCNLEPINVIAFQSP